MTYAVTQFLVFPQTRWQFVLHGHISRELWRNTGKRQARKTLALSFSVYVCREPSVFSSAASLILLNTGLCFSTQSRPKTARVSQHKSHGPCVICSPSSIISRTSCPWTFPYSLFPNHTGLLAVSIPGPLLTLPSSWNDLLSDLRMARLFVFLRFLLTCPLLNEVFCSYSL